jgi:hypothetical protein
MAAKKKFFSSGNLCVFSLGKIVWGWEFFPFSLIKNIFCMCVGWKKKSLGRIRVKELKSVDGRMKKKPEKKSSVRRECDDELR